MLYGSWCWMNAGRNKPKCLDAPWSIQHSPSMHCKWLTEMGCVCVLCSPAAPIPFPRWVGGAVHIYCRCSRCDYGWKSNYKQILTALPAGWMLALQLLLSLSRKWLCINYSCISVSVNIIKKFTYFGNSIRKKSNSYCIDSLHTEWYI